MDIKQEILEIKKRNQKVEIDKAWETSWFRIITLTLVTYIIATLVLWAIGISNYFQSALIPSIGYFLSTRSLPIIKDWWIRNFYK